MFTLVARPYTLRVGVARELRQQSRRASSATRLARSRSPISTRSPLGNPATFTQRRGAQPLTVGMTQAASVCAGRVRALALEHRYRRCATKRRAASATAAALAPRIGASRGFRRNTTNIRAGYGWFYGWMPVRIEEESIRLAQGSTEEEDDHPQSVVSRIRYRRGDLTTRRDPPTQLTLADDAELPRWQRMSIGIDHQIRQGMRLNFDTYYETTANDFRSLDLNAPVNGVRPDSNFGRMLLVQSIGRSRRTGFNVDFNFSPQQRFFSNVRYGFSANKNDGDDALTPPATGTFATEWARTREGQHRINWNFGVPIRRCGLNASINGRWNSGSYYTITTGRDDNADAIFNDRPGGVGRNTLRG